MNNTKTSREKTIKMIISDFIQSSFIRMDLELYPSEALMLKNQYEEIVIHMDGKHPEFRPSMYLITKSSN